GGRGVAAVVWAPRGIAQFVDGGVVLPISSYRGCDMLPKGELDSSNKISFLKKTPFWGLFQPWATARSA
ncbi:DUF825 domain-containing protein, partial [Mycobacterium tuberculosis]|nr:DUF825 domain-containing protein [Mycobacterium tuberculosis]